MKGGMIMVKRVENIEEFNMFELRYIRKYTELIENICGFYHIWIFVLRKVFKWKRMNNQ
jgi:hypothetical protein